MPFTMKTNQRLPRRFEDLVQIMPPRAIRNDVQYENTLKVIDRLMVIPKLTHGQDHYLETLVQLVQVYESTHHAIETLDISGIDALQYLLDENGMNASDLGRLLGVHPSMGSKILSGERTLTVSHLRKLSTHFKVSPDFFMD